MIDYTCTIDVTFKLTVTMGMGSVARCMEMFVLLQN